MTRRKDVQPAVDRLKDVACPQCSLAGEVTRREDDLGSLYECGSCGFKRFIPWTTLPPKDAA